MAVRRYRGWAMLGGLVLACSPSPASVELVVTLDPASPDFGTVVLQGLTGDSREALLSLSPDDERWRRVLSVAAVAQTETVPPMAGRYDLPSSGVLRFTPRYRPEGALTYRVRFDPSGLTRSRVPAAGDTISEWRIQLPPPIPEVRRTSLVGVYPSLAVIPANQLRWYLEFSGPMREGEAAQHVRLRDAAGRELPGSFLTLEEELWNPGRTRLTLLYDMGRVKRGIRSREDLGAVLVPGRRYQLEIDSSWRDLRGAPLVAGERHWFVAGPEDHEPVEPARWRISPPVIGSHQSLRIAFGKPLDHGLAGELIAVIDSGGRAVAGAVVLEDGDQSWRFTPDGPWLAGSYRLRVAPELEDPVGNRIAHAFEADLTRGQSAGVAARPVTLEFSPVSAD